MEPLQIIKDVDIFEDAIAEPKFYTRRPTASGIVFDEEGNIALLSDPLYSFFPSEKVKKKETAEESFIRVCEKMLGCNVAVVNYLGEFDEYRAIPAKKFEIHFFVAYVVGEKGVVHQKIKERDSSVLTWETKEDIQAILEDQQETMISNVYAPHFDMRTHLAAFKKFLEMNH